MKLLSYILSSCATVLGLCEPFGKKMRTVLIFNFLGNFLVALSYLAIRTYNGFFICCAACIQVLINYLFEKNNKKLPASLIAFYIISFTAINMLSFSHWYDLFALAASIIFVMSVAQTNTKFYRLYYVSNSMLWIIYDLCAGAYGNLSTHIILSLSIFTAIIVRDKKKNTN